LLVVDALIRDSDSAGPLSENPELLGAEQPMERSGLSGRKGIDFYPADGALFEQNANGRSMLAAQ
jgi:hypothetical protein